MIYTELTKKAMKIAYKIHRDQYQESGIPYIYHPVHVAEQMETEKEIATALLHDTLEDSGLEAVDLAFLGIDDDVIDAVILLTREPGADYMEYIERLKDNPLARKVKIEDLKHNSRVDRLEAVDEKVVRRLKRYKKALEVLYRAEE